MMVKLIICVHFSLCTVYHTLCIYLHWHSFCEIRMFIVQLFSNQLCLIIIIIVHYPNNRNVFQVFWSCNQCQHSKSMNIIHVHHKICAWFRLSIGFSKAIATILHPFPERGQKEKGGRKLCKIKLFTHIIHTSFHHTFCLHQFRGSLSLLTRALSIGLTVHF